MKYFNKTAAICLFINVIFLSYSYASTKFSPTCPAKIEITQQLSSISSGWRSFATEPHHFLNGITLYSGKPEDLASLRPDASSKTHSTWMFTGKEKIYIACEYNQTHLQLTQSLPEHTRQCSVWYDLTRQSGGGFIPKHIDCEKD